MIVLRWGLGRNPSHKPFAPLRSLRSYASGYYIEIVKVTPTRAYILAPFNLTVNEQVLHDLVSEG